MHLLSMSLLTELGAVFTDHIRWGNLDGGPQRPLDILGLFRRGPGAAAGQTTIVSGPLRCSPARVVMFVEAADDQFRCLSSAAPRASQRCTRNS
jgi:hypothetical protein